jgi:hypothetical protein
MLVGSIELARGRFLSRRAVVALPATFLAVTQHAALRLGPPVPGVDRYTQHRPFMADQKDSQISWQRHGITGR